MTGPAYTQYSKDTKKTQNINMDNQRRQQNTGTHDSPNKIRCIQINLQYSKTVTKNLLKTTDTDETEIIFIQEPYVYQN